jgi:hypothetical protein
LELTLETLLQLLCLDDINITLALGGSPLIALLAATTITVGWAGTLADARITSAATWNTAFNERRQWDGGTLNLVVGSKDFIINK